MTAVQGTPHYDRLNARCETELGWPFDDASFLYPEETRRIVSEVLVERWPHPKGAFPKDAS